MICLRPVWGSVGGGLGLRAESSWRCPLGQKPSNQNMEVLRHNSLGIEGVTFSRDMHLHGSKSYGLLNIYYVLGALQYVISYPHETRRYPHGTDEELEFTMVKYLVQDH